jgi:hypothetical protein
MASIKKKKVVLFMGQNFEALKRLDNGETMQNLASECGFVYVAVGDWTRRRKIEKLCSTGASNGGHKTKCMKKCEYVKVSEALFMWFTKNIERHANYRQGGKAAGA